MSDDISPIFMSSNPRVGNADDVLIRLLLPGNLVTAGKEL